VDGLPAERGGRDCAVNESGPGIGAVAVSIAHRPTAAATSRTSTNAPYSQNGSHSESGRARHRSRTRRYCASSQTATGRRHTVAIPVRAVKPGHPRRPDPR